MPFKSLAQMRWGNSPAGIKALGGPAKVKEWDSASKGLKLPGKVSGGLLGKALKRKPKLK
jgi:hypothetical protein